MKYSAICFDLDGVIINSEPLHEAAFRSVLLEYDLLLSANDYKNYFAGKTDEHGFEDYLSSKQANIPLPDLLTRKQLAYASLAPSKLTYYKGLPSLVRALSKIAPLALVTGSSAEETKIALSTHSLVQYFSAVVTAGDIKHSKPSPEGYLLAASKLAGFIEPTACIAIEDSPSGVQAAKQAGMYCVAITNTHTHDTLSMADAIVSRLNLHTFQQLIDP